MKRAQDVLDHIDLLGARVDVELANMADQRLGYRAPGPMVAAAAARELVRPGVLRAIVSWRNELAELAEDLRVPPAAPLRSELGDVLEQLAAKDRRFVRCLGCGKARPFEGAACPLCGELTSEDVDEGDVGEAEWVA